MANAKSFVVSTADFAFIHKGMLACTGTTNLNTSIEVSMQEQNVNAGKMNKLIYTFRYGREMAVTLEAADWKLEYIAANVGSQITEALREVYHIAECVDIVGGIGTLKSIPVGTQGVHVELSDGTIVNVKPVGSTIDLSAYAVEGGTVNATYQYNMNTKRIVIDADTAPLVGELILDADKHDNKLGKVGTVQIRIPSYQLGGNFSINFTPDGVTSTNMDGKALAVSGERCSDGSAVYAFIDEFDDTASAKVVSDIVATPNKITLAVDGEKEISVIGLKGGMYANIQLEAEDCVFTSNNPETATVTGNVVKGVQAGTTTVNVVYGEHSDVVEVTVA